MHEETPDLGEVVRGRTHEGDLRLRNLKARSAARLKETIRTKLNTSFIGAISRFEKFMGFVWGHQLPDSRCSKEQLELRKVWNECRTDVLNNGNNQIRAMNSEVNQYDVLWNRHHIDLSVKGTEQ